MRRRSFGRVRLRSRLAMRAVVCVSLLLPLLFAGCGQERFEWPASSPEREGLDPEAFRRWTDALVSRRTRALLVARNDRLIHEWYAPGRKPSQPRSAASLAKGVVGGLALALALGEGRLSLDDPVAGFLPAWRGDPRRSRITFRQLASHSSGLADAKPREEPGWRSDFWKRDAQRTPIHVAVEDVPVLFSPGTGHAYSSPGFAVLSAALSAAGASDLDDLLRDRLFRPIGMSDSGWIGYREPFRFEDREVWATWGGAAFVPRDLARLGRLLLRRGDWGGRRLIDAPALEDLLLGTHPPLQAQGHPGAGHPPATGEDARPVAAGGFWTNAAGVWPSAPRDAFLAAGAGHQLLLVVPSLDLVVVRNGKALRRDEFGGDFWQAVATDFVEPLMRTFPAPPVAWSDALPGVSFDPLDSARCEARGSDNWPMTWADDGHLYVAYGDGKGFDRATPKLSLGFARIEGTVSNFTGFNVRSPSGERSGDGPAGPKASGLLSVEGKLYMWVRNLSNSQLAWSAEHARTWHWGFRFEESFGSPAFLNDGRDYEGNRDGFVYVYSQDGPSAYASDDRVVLARVPTGRIREREAYEFFAGLDPRGEPLFARELQERSGVLDHPGRCRRIEVVRAPGIDRYLMALGFDHEGGWGMFEAPKPWGPWRTVYLTSRWDAGPTHSYRLPTAWIKNAGRSLRLVYSGRNRSGAVLDAFCVRAFHLPRRTPMAGLRSRR